MNKENTKMSTQFCSEALHHYVLRNGSKTEILKILGCKINLQHKFQNGDTVYHVIMRNEKLTEEEIIAIFDIFHDQRVNKNAKNQIDSAVVQLVIEKRMRKVADFLSNQNPSLFSLECLLIKLFIVQENVKFWHQVKQNCTYRNVWSSEKFEHESASFLGWLISKEFDPQNRQRIIHLDLLKLAVTNNLHHILLALLENVSAMHAYVSEFSDLFYQFFNGIVRARIRYNGKRSDVWYSNYRSRYTAKIVKKFIDWGATMDNCFLTCVSSAIKHNVLDVIKMFFDGFPDNRDGQSLATKLLEALIKHPCANLNGSEVQSYLQILRDLASKGVDLVGETMVSRGDCPVQVAVKSENVHAAEFLKEIKADFGVKTYWGQNLLHLLYGRRSKEQKMCEWLVNAGVDINGKARDGNTPLHYAVKHENAGLAGKLIELGADINSRNYENQTALHYAVRHNKTIELVQLLLEKGARVNAKDLNGRKPLFFAVFPCGRGSRLDMMQLLLKWGADGNAIFATNNELNYNYKLHTDAVEELLKYGLNSFTDFYLFDSSQIKSILERHCLKLKAANLLVAKNDAPHLCTAVDHQFYQECLKEVDTLKNTFIDNRTSLYAYLHMEPRKRCIYNNDVKFEMRVNNCYWLKLEFPIYDVPLVAIYREAVAKKSLLEKAKAAWLELTQITLPDICIERILFYLSVADLKDMIDVM